MESLSKNKIKWIRSLRQKKNRDAEGVFIVEGHKMVSEILENWTNLVELICTSNDQLNTEISCFLTDEKTMKELSSLSTPPSVIAIVKKPTFSPKDEGLILALDSIQDPGNMGTIIRTADWFGVEKIVCSKTTVDIFNPKVIQSSMGSLFRVQVEYCDLEEYLKSNQRPIYGALLEGENVYQESLDSSGVLVMGNEGNGISPEIQQLITSPVHIPGKGKAESLNVAIATAVLLSEFSRS